MNTFKDGNNNLFEICHMGNGAIMAKRIKTQNTEYNPDNRYNIAIIIENDDYHKGKLKVYIRRGIEVKDYIASDVMIKRDIFRGEDNLSLSGVCEFLKELDVAETRDIPHYLIFDNPHIEPSKQSEIFETCSVILNLNDSGETKYSNTLIKTMLQKHPELYGANLEDYEVNQIILEHFAKALCTLPLSFFRKVKREDYE